MKKFVFGLMSVAVVVAGVWYSYPFGGPPGTILSAEQKATCGLSVEVTEGPYYVSGTGPLVDGNLNAAGLPGTPITISGHVYQGLDNTAPVANAKIEIWHADASGSYHPNGNGDVAKYKPDEIALRGYVTTNAAGEWRFTTVYPGEYSGRTRHIHFKVTANGKTLTTQLIIPSLSGDAITFDDDTVAKGLPNCALLRVDTSTKPETAQFDFRV